MGALAVYYEPDNADGTIARVSCEPARHVDRRFDHHLPPEEQVQACLDLIGRKAKDHTEALAAAVERHHETRSIPRSAEPRYPETEGSVPAVNHSSTALSGL